MLLPQSGSMPGSSGKPGTWTIPLSRWKDDCLACENMDRNLMALFCPFCLFGKYADVMYNEFKEPPNEIKDSEGCMTTPCAIYFALGGPCMAAGFATMPPIGGMITLSSVYAFTFRGRIRMVFNIPGSGKNDCLSHYFCFPCALTQEYEELKYRQANPDKNVRVRRQSSHFRMVLPDFEAVNKEAEQADQSHVPTWMRNEEEKK